MKANRLLEFPLRLKAKDYSHQDVDQLVHRLGDHSLRNGEICIDSVQQMHAYLLWLAPCWTTIDDMRHDIRKDMREWKEQISQEKDNALLKKGRAHTSRKHRNLSCENESRISHKKPVEANHNLDSVSVQS